jgi:hypothetical protein
MIQPSPNLASSPPPAPVSVSAPPRHDRWLRRADLFLRVMLHLYLGLILVFAPWTHFWTYNRFLLYFAPVARITASGAVRGIVSGLGLLNLWIAIFDAIHYKES